MTFTRFQEDVPWPHARDWTPPPRGALGYAWVDIAELRAHGFTPKPWDR